MINRLIAAKFVVFLLLFTIFSLQTMQSLPLHDFDEANRAEGAKNMKEFGQYWAPLTGSPFLRVEEFRFEIPGKPQLEMFFHYERSPLVYWAMIGSTYLFGDTEFSYRLPSFIFGIMTIAGLIWFAVHLRKKDSHFFLAVCISLLAFMTSSDWWLSSQSALLDTALSFFLFVAVGSLMLYLQKPNPRWIIISGIGLSGAIMSKGPPSFIFIFPVLYLIATKKISFKHVVLLFFTAGMIVLPWALLSSLRFGLEPFIRAFVLDFVMSRASSITPEQQAPIFWYGRWWIESFRVGAVLFGSLLLTDIIRRSFSQEKLLLLFYIIPSFLLYSLVSNKVWWYVLPLIPAVSFYIFLSARSYLEKKGSDIALSLILILASFPLFVGSSNTVSLAYGLGLTMISFVTLTLFPRRFEFGRILFPVSVLITIGLFTLRFPTIQPTYPEARELGAYYQTLTEPKCLYVEGMPYESILFYTDAKEISYITRDVSGSEDCVAYLITPDTKLFEMEFETGRLKLYVR